MVLILFFRIERPGLTGFDCKSMYLGKHAEG